MYHNKSINTSPLNLYQFVRELGSFLRKKLMYIVIIFLFVIAYLITRSIFPNTYILNMFITNNGYSRKCLNLLESGNTLVYEINDFYKKYPVAEDKILPVFFQNMPKNLGYINDDTVKKNVFISILVPILLKVQLQTIEERKEVFELNKKLLVTPLTEDDFQTIRNLASKYRIKMDGEEFWYYTSALEELINRVDVIPMSLALAMAAKETGWGASRFLIEGNSLFSQWVWSEELGIIPKNRDKGKTHAVRSFTSLESAVTSFYVNINSHTAYKAFRTYRSNARLDGKTPDAYGLANRLTKYSLDPNYGKDLISIIRANNLTRFDNISVEFNNKYNSTCLNII